MMLVTITAAALLIGDRTAVDILRTPSGEMLVLTNAHVDFAAWRMAVLPIQENAVTPVSFLMAGGRRGPEPHDSTDCLRAGGPMPWGVVGDAMFLALNVRGSVLMRGVGGPVENVADSEFRASLGRIGFLLERKRGGWTPAHHREHEAFQKSTWSLCRPLMDYVRENAEELWDNWDITYDTVYTSLEDVTVVALRDGRMMHWTLDDTGDPDAPWTAHPPFSAPIRGVFRLLRAGKNLANMHFIDETGAIYTGFGEEHRKIGTVRDYHHADETTLTLLFEDQQTEKIGFLHAAEDGTIAVLPIDWQDESFAADFLTELDSDRTRAGIARLAEVLREDAEEGGE